MKLCILVVLALITYASAATGFQNEFAEDSISAQFGPQEIALRATSDVAEDDQALSIALTSLEKAQDRNIVADAIRNILEGFRDDVVNGDPPLDPLNIDHIGPFQYSASGVRVTGHLQNFEMEGLRWYLIDHVTFSTLRLALGVRVTIPWLTLTGRYGASARIGFLNHEAGGNYRVFLNRLETTVDIRVGTNIFGGGTLILRDLDIMIVIHDINIQINGMVGSSVLNGIINTLVQNAAQDLLRDDLEAFSKLLSQELFEAVNEFLGNFTLDDLLG